MAVHRWSLDDSKLTEWGGVEASTGRTRTCTSSAGLVKLVGPTYVDVGLTEAFTAG
jgi:hypothetical protein